MDMTQGKPAPLLVKFALPLVFTAILQQLYTLCDSIIIGHLLGADAFAAIGAATFLYGIPLNMLLGCTQGFSVSISQQFGAKDEEGQKRFFHAALLLSLVIGLVFTIAGILLLEPILKWMCTPDELMQDCIRYLVWLWGGLAITAVMNMEASALRAVGDSRTPLVALVVSSLVNIGLDVLLIAVFHMGAEGTALATVLSQLFAVIYCLRGIKRMGLFANTKPCRVRIQEVRELLRLGIPPALSQGVTAAAGSLYQSVINRFGVAVITGISASYRYFNLLNVIGYGMEGATGTFAGQNAGAKNYVRIRLGTKKAVQIGIGASIIINVGVIVFARPLILLFLPTSTVQAVQVGVTSLRINAVFLVFMYLLCAYRAAIQGLGNSFLPMISGFGELLLKTAAILTLPAWFGQSGVYYVDAAAWIPVALFVCAGYHWLIGNLEKEESKNQKLGR